MRHARLACLLVTAATLACSGEKSAPTPGTVADTSDAAVDAGQADAGAVDTALRTAAKKLDQAASKKFIHRNKAARLKSRLSALAKKSAAAK